MSRAKRTLVRLGWQSLLVLSMAAQSVAMAAADPVGDAKPPVLEPMAAGGLMQMLLGLVAVLLLIVGLAWAMRRLGGVPGTAAGSLRILGGLSMGTRERVVLVQVGETQLLLGVAPGRVQTLHVLDQPIPTDGPNSTGKGSFASNLNAALRRGRPS